MTRLAIGLDPKVRIVYDVAFPLNASSAMVHLPLIRRITSCSNCSFLGCDMLYAFPDFLADFSRASWSRFDTDVRIRSSHGSMSVN